MTARRATTVNQSGEQVSLMSMLGHAEVCASALWPEVHGEGPECGRTISVISGAMPPPAEKRPSIRMLSSQLGLSCPL